jgi:hypothetical protein
VYNKNHVNSLHLIKYTDAEVFIRLILGDGVVQILDKVN